jgi:hypothetical protein
VRDSKGAGVSRGIQVLARLAAPEIEMLELARLPGIARDD